MEQILVPVDLADAGKAEALVKEAVKYGQRQDVSFTLLHVVSALPGYMTADLAELFAEKMTENARTRLESFAQVQASALKAKTMVRVGTPQHEIIAVAKEIDADLIIIASHKPEAVDYLLGSVAAAVVRHAPCSVLVYRNAFDHGKD